MKLFLITLLCVCLLVPVAAYGSNNFDLTVSPDDAEYSSKEKKLDTDMAVVAPTSHTPANNKVTYSIVDASSGNNCSGYASRSHEDRLVAMQLSYNSDAGYVGDYYRLKAYASDLNTGDTNVVGVWDP